MQLKMSISIFAVVKFSALQELQDVAKELCEAIAGLQENRKGTDYT